MKMYVLAMVLVAADLCAAGAERSALGGVGRVDTSTLRGKVMCGYQGWFRAVGDGTGLGWRHWGRGGRFGPGRCSIDLWPDVSELGRDEKYPTAFRHKDGRVAHVFSSANRQTVMRHFRWMREYGIDGVFVQRFATEVRREHTRRHCDTVLTNCRLGANTYGRAYAVMYDLSGLGRGQTQIVIDDWKRLVNTMGVARNRYDRAYLRHGGKPVVAIWGVGFKDGRQYTLAECGKLVDYLARDATYGGATVMLGVPTGWRTLDQDAVKDRRLHEVIGKAAIVSPWTVGRYTTIPKVVRHGKDRWAPDIAWCKARGKEYLPVVFPGFSWHNMKRDSPLGKIPRLGGKFLWAQYTEARKAGATMIYQAMFDEVDEGTAIFKCTNDPPVGASRFLTYENLPSDHYLWLVGMGGRLLRGEIPPTAALPARKQRPADRRVHRP